MADESKTPITETLEFKDAVKAAALELVPTIVAQIAAANDGAAPAGISSGDKAFAESLAMAISQLTDQGTGRKRVAPEIIEARAKARERMTDLIIEARSKGIRPAYQLKQKAYLDEVMIEPFYIDPATKQPKATEIEWPGVPNEGMVPVNDAARAIHAAFIESIGSVVKVVPEDKLGITPGGLVIKNGAVNARRAIADAAGDGTSPHGEGLRIAHKSAAPGVHKEIRVLGTVAPAARVGAGA